MNVKTKQISYLALLIIFLPTAIYLLAVREFLLFLILSGMVWIIIKLLKKQN